MREIRLRWTVGMSDDDGHPKEGGLWMPDTKENRELLWKLMDAGNEAAGYGTHWIEEREA